eukprot:m.448414 g.448414  ORF g.448414 m.448414 type:complete len:122 (+) comp19657_c0_seq1:1239-1604(+)
MSQARTGARYTRQKTTVPTTAARTPTIVNTTLQTRRLRLPSAPSLPGTSAYDSPRRRFSNISGRAMVFVLRCQLNFFGSTQTHSSASCGVQRCSAGDVQAPPAPHHGVVAPQYPSKVAEIT